MLSVLGTAALITVADRYLIPWPGVNVAQDFRDCVDQTFTPLGFTITQNAISPSRFGISDFEVRMNRRETADDATYHTILDMRPDTGKIDSTRASGKGAVEVEYTINREGELKSGDPKIPGSLPQAFVKMTRLSNTCPDLKHADVFTNCLSQVLPALKEGDVKIYAVLATAGPGATMHDRRVEANRFFINGDGITPYEVVAQYDKDGKANKFLISQGIGGFDALLLDNNRILVHHRTDPSLTGLSLSDMAGIADKLKDLEPSLKKQLGGLAKCTKPLLPYAAKINARMGYSNG